MLESLLGNQIVGFDIGEEAVKMAAVVGGQPKKAIYADLPDDIVRGGEILAPDAMADFLKETAKLAGLSGGSAAFVIPDSQVMVRNITLPVMTAPQLKYNLPFEFKDYLTEEKANYNYDYAVREIINDEEGKPKEMSLLACAILKSQIAEYRDMFRRAGFNLKIAVPVIYAMERYIESSPEFPKDRTFAIVDIGHTTTKIYFCNEGKLESNSTVECGVINVINNVAYRDNIDMHIAQQFVASNFNNILQGDSVKDEFNNMSLEIMKVINFYNYNHHENMVETLYMAGGGALMDRLCNTIGSVIGVSVRPCGRGGEKKIKDPALYLPAIGCTL